MDGQIRCADWVRNPVLFPGVLRAGGVYKVFYSRSSYLSVVEVLENPILPSPRRRPGSGQLFSPLPRVGPSFGQRGGGRTPRRAAGEIQQAAGTGAGELAARQMALPYEFCKKKGFLNTFQARCRHSEGGMFSNGGGSAWPRLPLSLLWLHVLECLHGAVVPLPVKPGSQPAAAPGVSAAVLTPSAGRAGPSRPLSLRRSRN